jgi:hypothetical protein
MDLGYSHYFLTRPDAVGSIQSRDAEADVYLGVLGMRYGSIDPSSGFSMTELEYK